MEMMILKALTETHEKGQSMEEIDDQRIVPNIVRIQNMTLHKDTYWTMQAWKVVAERNFDYPVFGLVGPFLGEFILPVPISAHCNQIPVESL